MRSLHTKARLTCVKNWDAYYQAQGSGSASGSRPTTPGTGNVGTSSP
jgi:hypothetical protein